MKKKLQAPKISYDKESQVLSIEVQKAKSVDSDIQRNIVVDYDKKGQIVRINFYNFNFDTFRNGFRTIKAFVRRFGNAVLVK